MTVTKCLLVKMHVLRGSMMSLNIVAMSKICYQSYLACLKASTDVTAGLASLHMTKLSSTL